MKESIGDKARRAQFEKNGLRNDLVVHIPDKELSFSDGLKDLFEDWWNSSWHKNIMMLGEGCSNMKAGVDPFKENEEPSKAVYVSNSSISDDDMRKLRLKYYYCM